MEQRRPTALEWQHALAEAEPTPNAVDTPAPTAIDEAAIAAIVQQQLSRAAPASRRPILDIFGKRPRIAVLVLWIIAIVIPLGTAAVGTAWVGNESNRAVAAVRAEGQAQTGQVAAAGTRAKGDIQSAGQQAAKTANDARDEMVKDASQAISTVQAVITQANTAANRHTATVQQILGPVDTK